MSQALSIGQRVRVGRSAGWSVVLDQLDTRPAVRRLHVRDICDDTLQPDNRFDPFPFEMGVRRLFETKQFTVEMHRPGKILNGDIDVIDVGDHDYS